MKLNRNNRTVKNLKEIRTSLNSLMSSREIREKMVQRLELNIVRVV